MHCLPLNLSLKGPQLQVVVKHLNTKGYYRYRRSYNYIKCSDRGPIIYHVHVLPTWNVSEGFLSTVHTSWYMHMSHNLLNSWTPNPLASITFRADWSNQWQPIYRPSLCSKTFPHPLLVAPAGAPHSWWPRWKSWCSQGWVGIECWPVMALWLKCINVWCLFA